MIEVQTIFNSAITMPLIRFQLRKIRIFLWLFPLFLILLAVLIIVLEGDLTVAMTMIVCGVLYYPAVFLLSKHLQKKNNQTLKLMSEETRNNYTFTEDRIYQETVRGNEYRAVSEQSYSMLFKAYETQSHFFIYISNIQTHVIPKKDIVKGTASELSALLLARLGPKFKYVNTK